MKKIKLKPFKHTCPRTTCCCHETTPQGNGTVGRTLPSHSHQILPTPLHKRLGAKTTVRQEHHPHTSYVSHPPTLMGVSLPPSQTMNSRRQSANANPLLPRLSLPLLSPCSRHLVPSLSGVHCRLHSAPHLPLPHWALAQQVGGVGEVLKTSNIGEERDDGNDLAMSVAQGEVGPRDQVGSVSLTQEEGSEGNTSSVWGPVASELSRGHPDGNSCA